MLRLSENCRKDLLKFKPHFLSSQKHPPHIDTTIDIDTQTPSISVPFYDRVYHNADRSLTYKYDHMKREDDKSPKKREEKRALGDVRRHEYLLLLMSVCLRID